MNETNPASGTPDRGIHVSQVDPSRQYAYYRFSYGDTVLAELIAVNEGSDRYAFIADQEYWRFNGDRTSIDTYEYKNLDVTKEARNWDQEPPFNSSDQTDFICSLRPAWSSVDPYLPPIACHHYDELFGPCGFRLSVSRPDTKSEWVGTITWVRPMERFAPLFLNGIHYQLGKVSLDQGSTVTNLVGTHWTGPITNYGDGDEEEWKDQVLVSGFATGIQVIYGDGHYGIVNARLVLPDGTSSAWTSDDEAGDHCPSDDQANLGFPVTQVSVRTGWYLNYSLGLVNLDCGAGWVTPFESDNTIAVYIPPRCAVVGIQGQKRPKYGLVDMKIAYREVP